MLEVVLNDENVYNRRRLSKMVVSSAINMLSKSASYIAADRGRLGFSCRLYYTGSSLVRTERAC